MLDLDQLQAWATQIGRALYDAGVTIGPDHFEVVEVPYKQGCAAHLEVRFDCPHWVRGRKALIKLRPDATHEWKGPDASVRAMAGAIRKAAPRCYVPPAGDAPFAVSLTERNGWEGESWGFYIPIAHEASVRRLVDLHQPSEGQDVRVTPFDPQSLRRFGSWSIEIGYLRAERAQKVAADSLDGYMRFRNWCPSAGPELDALFALAEERGLVRWHSSDADGTGIGMWKGRITLQDKGKVIASVNLQHEGES